MKKEAEKHFSEVCYLDGEHTEIYNEINSDLKEIRSIESNEKLATRLVALKKLGGGVLDCLDNINGRITACISAYIGYPKVANKNWENELTSIDINIDDIKDTIERLRKLRGKVEEQLDDIQIYISDIKDIVTSEQEHIEEEDIDEFVLSQKGELEEAIEECDECCRNFPYEMDGFDEEFGKAINNDIIEIRADDDLTVKIPKEVEHEMRTYHRQKYISECKKDIEDYKYIADNQIDDIQNRIENIENQDEQIELQVKLSEYENLLDTGNVKYSNLVSELEKNIDNIDIFESVKGKIDTEKSIQEDTINKFGRFYQEIINRDIFYNRYTNDYASTNSIDSKRPLSAVSRKKSSTYLQNNITRKNSIS